MIDLYLDITIRTPEEHESLQICNDSLGQTEWHVNSSSIADAKDVLAELVVQRYREHMQEMKAYDELVRRTRERRHD